MNAFLASCYWLALTIWIAAILAPAAAGMAVFRVLPQLNGTFPEFTAVATANQAALAGGHIVNPLFIFSNVVQIVCAAIAIFALGIEQLYWRPAHHSRADYVRIPTLLMATILILVEICILGPIAREHLYAYWDAVQSNSMDIANQAKTAFDALHPVGTTLYAVTFGLLLITVVASAVAYTPPHSTLLGTGNNS